MRIDVKGRNLPVTDELRALVERRFARVAKQVSPLATLEVELREERNPVLKPVSQVVAATLYVKGTKLRACDRSFDMGVAIHKVADEMSVQVKRHREKRRHRRDSVPLREIFAEVPADGPRPYA